jgi:hypothetical protein
MKTSIIAAGLLLGLGLASCNENTPPQQEAQPIGRQSFLGSLQGQQFTASPGVAVSPAPEPGVTRASVMPRPGVTGGGAAPQVSFPKDARWTLYCMAFAGPDRVAQATQMKDYLSKNTPFKDWYVVHNENDSTLFYGFYPSVERKEVDPGAAKAHRERDAILHWKDRDGRQPFVTAFFTPITPPDPTAPLEWELTHAPNRAFWSVQVAAFCDNPLRKQAAVEMVKEMRGKGIEAYYYHGTSVSSVCVGAWPMNAVAAQDIDGSSAYETASQDDTILVTPVPLPDKYKNASMKDRDGTRIKAYAERIEIADPSLAATLKDYPEHTVNYERRSRQVKAADGKMVDVITPSFLVKIPGVEDSLLNAGTARGGAAGGGSSVFDQVANTSRSNAPGAGRQPAETQGLRSLNSGGNDVWAPRR